MEEIIDEAKQELTSTADEEHNQTFTLNSKVISDRESEYQKQKYSTHGESGTFAERMKSRIERKRRWDVDPIHTTTNTSNSNDDKQDSQKESLGWGDQVDTPRLSKWDQTPDQSSSKWDQTPRTNLNSEMTPDQSSSKWDQTPRTSTQTSRTNLNSEMTPRAQQELEYKNRYLSDEDLNLMLPIGYEILVEPQTYKPIMTPSRKLTQTPMTSEQGFVFQEELRQSESIPGIQGLEFFKEDDRQYFNKLVDGADEHNLSLDDLKERKVMRLLLKIKNGSPSVRKIAMRQLIDSARLFGPTLLFDNILPILMSPTLEDQERHLLVKVVDRIMFTLDDLVRPYAHKILVVIEPMLIDEDYYARIEGREIISNLAKAAGLATMISVMRPDVDHQDEYVRNTTARAFAVLASALGVLNLIPFLKAVCRSKKSWQARHTGVKIIQQISILLGCGILPFLKELVLCIADNLQDEQGKVRTVTALAIAALAEAAAPYGIESFAPVIPTLFQSIQKIKGKNLAASFKAIGFIIPLFDNDRANLYTRKCMPRLIDEFRSPDAEMKKVIKQCVNTEGVDAAFIKSEILPKYFQYFWVRGMSLDRRSYKQLVETSVEIAQKVGVADIVSRVVEDFKDESDPFRRMTAEVVDAVIKSLGTFGIDDRLCELLVDGILFAFQEQVGEDQILLEAFGTIVQSLGIRVKKFLPQICSTILWRLNNKSAKVRQQAADLVAKIAQVLLQCGEEKLMGQLGVVLYEYLGEEYPEVLGSILNGLKAIVNVIGMTQMTPPIKDLLPRLTPILKNRHEKVQEHCVDLVGRIADRGAEFVAAREWMRICFELLDMLKAQRKGIRRAAVNTFGYIAKAIGPQDVLATLLNNLKVQERQNRVCTTVAIAIVAETCSPFTVLPALMNEYRVPELNVQNGCLKALSFLFEYIGEMAKDYIYAVTSLLEDALMDRDLVHRQTACATVKHLAIGVVGMGCEDAIQHLFNLVWPNIFENAAHVAQSVTDALEGCRVCLGPGVLVAYTLQGLFHPARRVREVYWKVWNNIYIGDQSKLVCYYPDIKGDERNNYERWEMDYIV